MASESPAVDADTKDSRPWIAPRRGRAGPSELTACSGWLRSAPPSARGCRTYAQSWLVFDLTKSNFYLGLDNFLAQLPILLFMLIGGVIADRHDRRRLLTGSQYVQAFSAFTLTALILTGHVKVGFIFALSFIAGCGQAFGGPAYQSLIPSLVPRRDLPNAIALNSTQFNLSRVLGPAAGGVCSRRSARPRCFALNGLSFFFVVFALAALHLPPHTPPPNRRALGEELKSGLHYVRDNRAHA